MRAADIINIKLMKTGGISNAIHIADIAAMYQVECMIGCMVETSISVAAAVHLAVAKSNVITKVDLDGPSLCAVQPGRRRRDLQRVRDLRDRRARPRHPRDPRPANRSLAELSEPLMSPLLKIRSERDQMSAIERRIADFLLENAHLLRDYSSQQLADALRSASRAW